MGDADCAFELLAGLLLELGAKDATAWVFLGDGGVWIWKRLALLVELVGFDPARVTQVLDFYHAVEHVNEIQELFPAWSKAERSRWRENVKSFLRRGDVQGLVFWIRSSLCEGPESTKVEAQLVYLLDNETRMDYGLFKRRRLPLGSGAIESGSRRIINLRLKGNGIFWTLANAEGVIHMRAELLSGRWNEFMRAVLQPEAKWAA